MDYTISEFYSVRLRLMLMNPFEMALMIGAPALILWNAFRQHKRSIFWAWGVFTLIGWPLVVASGWLHFQLIAWWTTHSPAPPQALVHMLDGDGPKMIVGMILGGVASAVYFLLWLIILSPVLFWTRRKQKAKKGGPGDSAQGALSPDP